MKVLGIDFSSPQRSVALLETIPGAPGVRLTEVVETGAPHTAALGVIEQVLREAAVEREAVECLAVGIGPGSYTGIRASIALAQGWQLMAGTRLLGISSAEAVAAEAAGSGLVGPVLVVIDAQRNEFYLARYDIQADGPREVEPLRLATLAETQSAAAQAQIAGPEVTRWFPTGRLIFPRAARLGRLALNRTDFLEGEKMEPIYLRETRFVKAPPPRILPPA